MKHSLHIDVYFEFICPWCLIGKRQLQMAIAELQRSHPTADVTITWHGIQLLPFIPVKGVPFKDFYLQRLGSEAAVSLRQAQVREAAQSVGVTIDFDRIPLMPNTARAHHLFSQLAPIGTPNQQAQLLEHLFSAYFENSQNLSEPAVLLDIATACGYPITAVQTILETANAPFVSANTGGQGVPYFVFDGMIALSGAQPAHILYQAMREVVETQEAVV